MRIRKQFDSVQKEGKVLNSQSSSQSDTYSCDYINKLDTGWQNIASYLKSGISASQVRVRKIGKLCYLRIYNVTGWTTGTVFLTIPEGYRPSVYYRVLTTMGGTNYARFEMGDNGDVKITATTGTQGAWCDINFTYFVD